MGGRTAARLFYGLKGQTLCAPGFSATARSAERRCFSKIFTRVNPWGAPSLLTSDS
jgi:hypothetical protein